ncbi:hypothetical protein [Allomuricauda sp. R78024]|uniref:hypothetical protein n=1 Tax=Allomuricauda sp. R78024 TaxID=3093867 RepID=UPI0037CAEC58
MRHTKILTLLFLILIGLSNCSKDDGFDSDILTTIESPYILEALREQNKTSIKEVESLTELKLTLNVNKQGEDYSDWRYDYNLEESNLLAGISQFKNLKKLILVIRGELTSDKTKFADKVRFAIAEDVQPRIIAAIENLDNLEEIYFSSQLKICQVWSHCIYFKHRYLE